MFHLQSADITPVHKKKDPILVEDYRPDSILPPVTKITFIILFM